MKRSVSPTSDVGPDSQPSKWRLIRVFSAIKDALAGPKETLNFAMDANTSRDDIAQDIPTSFVSRKRQNSVIESLRHASQSVPRGSLSVQPLQSGYETVRNSLRTERQAINGNSMLIVEDGSVLLKEVSPSVYVPRNQILPMNPMEMDLDLERSSQLPFLDQNEYAPLYCDDEGNLVRPPFINFDPRERYQMLKLKKSVEASEHLRNSMKYMVDPDETTSINRPNNKVDCSTQTYNQDYLEKTLHFTALRKKLAIKSRKQRNSTRQKGFFSGSFMYDPVETKAPADQGSKLKGYLGELHQPQFPSKDLTLLRKLPLDEDQAPTLKFKSKLSERVGLEDALRTGKSTTEVPSDENGNSESIANLIQVKHTPLPAKKTGTGPSSGFKFDIDKNSIVPLLNKKDPAPLAFNTKPTEVGSKAPSSEFSFNTDLSKPQSQKTLFSLTAPDEDDDARVKKKSRSGLNSTSSTTTANSNFLFGKSDSVEKPSFSFSAPAPAVSKPLFGTKSPESTKKQELFGKDEANTGDKSQKEPNPKPAFTLSAEKPLFQATSSFSKTTEAAGFLNNTKKPTGNLAFSDFGSKPVEPSKPNNSDSPKPAVKAPTFSFGAPKTSKDGGATTLTLFGGAKNSETTSLFGGNSEEKPKEADAKPSILGASNVLNASKVPSFSFTQDSAKTNPAPSFSFGPPARSDDKASTESGSAPSTTEKKEAPSFLFGTPAPTSEKEKTLSFLLSNTKPETAATIKKPALFGAASDSAKPFTFGAGTTSSADSSNKTKPLGVFGGSASSPLAAGLKPATSLNNTPSATNLLKTANTPAFGQSQSSTPQPEAPKPSFNFGANTLVDPASIFGGGSGNTPAPSFNFSVGNLNKEVSPAPVLNFSQPATQKPGGFSFSNKALGGFSGGSNTSLSGGFGGFGATSQNDTNALNSGNVGGFGNTSATPSAFGNASRSVTPSATSSNNFNFGGNNTMGGMQPNTNQFQQSAFGNNNNQAPAFGTPQPAFGTPQPAFGTSQPAFGTPQPSFGNPVPAASGGFQFSNNAPGGQAFGSGPGSFGTGSRETTPSAFGGIQGDQGGQPFAPPIANISNRKIAQMRQRKRF